MHRLKSHNKKAFTLIEMIAVLTIASITLIAVLDLYQKCVHFTITLRQRAAQDTELNYCLDRMMTEITDSVSSNAELELIKSNGSSILSGVTLTEYNEEDNSEYRKVEWVIAADFNDAYSIYRKDEIFTADEVDDNYYPVCDRIAKFDIDIINGDGLEDPNAEAPLVQFYVESYINDNDNHTFSANRTFCLRRGESLGVRDINKVDSDLETIRKDREKRKERKR